MALGVQSSGRLWRPYPRAGSYHTGDARPDGFPGRRAAFAALTLAAIGWGFAPRAAATTLEPLVRGHQAVDGEVVVLCSDISERSGVFTARDGEGLAGAIAGSGRRVFLWDPWDDAKTRAEGFDAVVREHFPAMLEQADALAQGAGVAFVGHGLCGLLPVAHAAAPSGRAVPYRWVALGTRFDYRRAAPALSEWLGAWGEAREPLPNTVVNTLFTGLREGLGARSSSVPAGVQDDGREPGVVLEAFHRRTLMRAPPKGVVDDLRRWFQAGRMTDDAGWLDYGLGVARVAGPGLVVSGASDPAAPPEDAAPAALAMAAAVRFHLLGRDRGDREEYGHLGMLLSRHSARDVDGLVLAFLQGREVLP